ncbi:hypothetical protein ES707_17820 [subsurface metagenome]
MTLTHSGKTLKEALKFVGGSERLVATKEQYSGSVMFLNSTRQELLKKYRQQWVAVYQSHVIANAKKYDDVIQELGAKDVPIEETVIKYLSDREMMTLF